MLASSGQAVLFGAPKAEIIWMQNRSAASKKIVDLDCTGYKGDRETGVTSRGSGQAWEKSWRECREIESVAVLFATLRMTKIKK